MQAQYTQPRPSGPMGPAKARRLLIAEYGNLCFRCFHAPVITDDGLDVDHIVPHALGGQHVYENYQLLCGSCNIHKGLRVADYRPGTRSMDVTLPRPFVQPWARSRSLPPRERKLVVKRIRPLRRADGEYEWVSVKEAGERLGVSVSTIRRMVDAGQLVGEREVIGGARDRYMIRFNRQEMPHEASFSESEDESDDTTAEQGSAVTLGLLAELREMRQQSANDAERIAGLMRQLGAAEASVKLLAEQRADFAAWLDEARAEVERLRKRTERRRWWAWWM